ncbi:MAG: SH3 domain-containing protein [Lachnospiraceae bacterium]|nr:SH3 domain-containing protein [Lachnospiraceae bacterium]
MAEKRAAKKLLLFVTVFYIAVSVLAVAILNLSGSIFARRGEVNLFEYFTGLSDDSREPAGENAEDTAPESKLEGLEALGKKEEAISEMPSEPETEAYEAGRTETYEEPEPEEEPAEEEAEEEHYYSFKTNNTDTILRMREEPGEDGRVIYELKPGSSGYVTELGDEWSKVSAYGHEGYCANEFLTMTEITESEYDTLKEKSDSAVKDKGTESKEAADAAALILAASAGGAGNTDTAAQAAGTLNAAQAAGTGDAAQAAETDANAAGTADAAPPEDP